MSVKRQRQRQIRLYLEETGKSAFDMNEVAEWAMKRGIKAPQPQRPIDLLAKQFRDAARSEILHDPDDGKPYRVYHAVRNDGQLGLFTWVNIHDAPRRAMHKSAYQRREQMIGDGLQLTLDLRTWNKLHSDEEPIHLTMDLSPDVEWRMNTPEDDDEVA